jgi:hypothetical protein
MRQFEHFKGDVLIKQRNKVPLTAFERDCGAVWSQLGTWVAHRSEVQEEIFFVGTERQAQHCPGRWELDATPYAKGLTLYRWSPKRQELCMHSLEDWLASDEHLRSSVVMFSTTEIGKSKVAHLIAQELCVGMGQDRYCFCKAVDSLGVLSYAGDLRSSGAICLMDISFSASRGKVLGAEEFKALFDVQEGGTIKDTRYKPAVLPSGVPRVLGLQGSASDAGRWFRDHSQPELGAFLEAIAPQEGRRETVQAFKARVGRLAATFGHHEQAILRRVSVALPSQPLETEEFVRRMEGETSSRAAAARAKRKAHWAAQAKRM